MRVIYVVRIISFIADFDWIRAKVSKYLLVLLLINSSKFKFVIAKNNVSNSSNGNKSSSSGNSLNSTLVSLLQNWGFTRQIQIILTTTLVSPIFTQFADLGSSLFF